MGFLKINENTWINMDKVIYIELSPRWRCKLPEGLQQYCFEFIVDEEARKRIICSKMFDSKKEAENWLRNLLSNFGKQILED